MKQFLIICALVPLFTACASQQEMQDRRAERLRDLQEQRAERSLQKLPAVEMHFMSRAEVSAAIAECESLNQQPIVQYGTANVNEGRISLPVNVLCIPRPKRGLFSKLFD